MSDRLAVWWVSEADCKQIGCPMADEDYESEKEEMGWTEVPQGSILESALDMPEYIKSEYSSRWGRAGRGRLWIPEGIELPGGIPWDEHNPVCMAVEECGGIVFRQVDLPAMLKFPGLFTDTTLGILHRSQQQ